MPELPEVEALAAFLRERLSGRSIARIDVAAVSALKTYAPPPTALHGLSVNDVRRLGKFLDVDVSGVHLVIHLARAGWLVWRDALPAKTPYGKGPLAVRVRLDDNSGFDLTEQGTKKGLAIYVVRDVGEVPGVARLGIDVLDDAFTLDRLHAATKQHRGQLKGLLTDQTVVAGIGNAYSDEVLHAAKLSPFKPAANLTDDEVARLHASIHEVLTAAVRRSQGLVARDLKTEKKSGLAVHGRTGEPCPVCGDTIREVSFADSSLQYCATCQTGGKPLADRRLSRLLK